ncbi:hypothetical protein [Paraburkholderia caffeinilytica]|uniref:Uncharacterized protein n=1 Tax=Paraburkholderia caffeinilytica TaxID=1761016 RepID=A0ABQ1NDB6_9BURK|nr:hypothetical protein [Paraburkholderia caffeinilytica]GGC72777.1 hypothetical protein GCM10011400_71130 [Paraburkholderia caffeinilytica]
MARLQSSSNLGDGADKPSQAAVRCSNPDRDLERRAESVLGTAANIFYTDFHQKIFIGPDIELGIDGGGGEPAISPTDQAALARQRKPPACSCMDG